MINPIQISLKYTNGIVLPTKNYYKKENLRFAPSITAMMMQLGFIPSKELFQSFTLLNKKEAATILQQTINQLKQLVGADVKYEPMYPNFPQQVMEASDTELFVNAIFHYLSAGHWSPTYEKQTRSYYDEKVQYKTIGLTPIEEFKQIGVTLLKSNDSLSDFDKNTISYFVNTHPETLTQISEIPFKENLCYYAKLLLDQDKFDIIQNSITSATDILRVVTALSDGDISLATNTKFISLPRKIRKVLVETLETVIKEEDIARHRGKWIKLFHNLHVGDYSEKVFKIAKLVRNNEHITTVNSKIEQALLNKDIKKCVSLLKTRPGDFARRIGHVLRISPSMQKFVINEFLTVADKISTRVLLQLRGSIKSRMTPTDKLIVFPKGNVQKAIVVNNEIPKLNNSNAQRLIVYIDRTLRERFGSLSKLGKVWIDPELKDCPLPTGQRSTSEGLFQVARGTRLPIDNEEKNTIRLFIYWIGMDIDLSATFHDDKFNMIEQVSYTNLRSSKYQAWHSGDITKASSGASEFIDIDIKSALKYGARYVAMDVLVFSGPTFEEHEQVYAGWMTRSKVKSNEVYTPKTVKQKIDLTSKSKLCIPVIFDLQERKAIWADLTSPARSFNWGNNIHSNKANISETLEAIVSLKKTNLHELFTLHGKSRGEIVENKEDADVVFSTKVEDNNITPYDISMINAEYIS